MFKIECVKCKIVASLTEKQNKNLRIEKKIIEEEMFKEHNKR